MTTETLTTLISGESDYSNGETTARNTWEETFIKPNPVSVSISVPLSSGTSPNTSDSTAVADGYMPKARSQHLNRLHSFGPPDSIDTPFDKDDQFGLELQSHPAFPRHDQRTILFTNLSDRTTHKDLVNIIRGGRLLDIYIRNDRSATVSFVEGAQDFLAYAKRNDIYVNTKRVNIRTQSLTINS